MATTSSDGGKPKPRRSRSGAKPSGRIIGLPSTTSNGLFSVGDENAYTGVDPSALPRPKPIDKGFIASTEAAALEALNEDLQRRLAVTELKKEDAFAALAQAETQTMNIERETLRMATAAEARDQALRKDMEAMRLELERCRDDLVACQAHVLREKEEVKRAVAHARRAGAAADEARRTLEVERQCYTDQHRATTSRVNKETEEALAAAQRDLLDAKRQIADLEEDVETERAWREKAQKERLNAETRCHAFEQEAGAAAAAADRNESARHKAQENMEALRQQHEEETSNQREAERKASARRRQRDLQAVNHRQHEAEKAKLFKAENQVAELRQIIEELEQGSKLTLSLKKELKRERAGRLQLGIKCSKLEAELAAFSSSNAAPSLMDQQHIPRLTPRHTPRTTTPPIGGGGPLSARDHAQVRFDSDAPDWLRDDDD